MSFLAEFPATGKFDDSSKIDAFSFNGPDGFVAGRGDAVAVPPGPAASLADRLSALALQPGEIIGGAMPFDKTGDDCLWRAGEIRSKAARPVASQPAPLREFSLLPEPWAEDYAALVREALGHLGAEGPDALQKIVLARSLLIQSPAPIAVDALLARLAHDPAATAFRVRLSGDAGSPEMQNRHLVGATPELLLRKRGTRVSSHPLAGSARRAREAAEDRRIAQTLSGSEKDRREHGYVVDYILDTLAPYCANLSAPRGIEVTHTANMWHLGTEIVGTLRDSDLPAAVLASILHPTPAICGVPVAAARQLIGELEPVPRDFYAGTVGWSDAAGDGTWYVAIRCADVMGATARLFAGAGIVLGSDPMSEAIETGAKFGALLAALGIPADAVVAGLVQGN